MPSVAPKRVNFPLSRQTSPPPRVPIQRRPAWSSSSARIQLLAIAGVFDLSKTTERTPSKRARPSTVPIQR